jgi:hypothetical protein
VEGVLLVNSKWIDRKILLPGLGLLLYGVMIVMSPRRLLYDEVYYVPTVIDLREKGPSLQFLQELRVPAGPLYAAVQFGFFPLTQLLPPGIRFVNLLFLAGVIAALAWALSNRLAPKDAFNNAAKIVVAPTIGVATCLALTELPAMFFCTIAVALIVNLRSGRLGNDSFRLLKVLGAGTILGLAVTGRQNFLMVWLASGLLFLPLSRKSISEFAIFSAPILFVVVALFFAWGGLVPRSVDFVATGYSFVNLTFSLAIVYVVCFVCIPDFVKTGVNFYLIYFIIGLVLCLLMPEIRYVPSRTWSTVVFGDRAMPWIGLIGGAAVLALAAVVIVSVGKRIMENLGDYCFLFATAAWVMILVSNIKITHQFSTRYVTVALPLVLLSGSLIASSNKWEAPRLIGGLLLSVVSVFGYYRFV